MQAIEITKTRTKKEKPDQNVLGFGKYYTDHMFILNYTTELGWHQPRIVPYQPITLDPSAKVFHYGQTVFEGLKAYKTTEGKILLFRPEKNIQRLNQSNERLCIPHLDEQVAIDALKQLVLVDEDWLPTNEGTSIYIRPFIIATESALGVATSTQYQFIIIMSPVGAYYAEGLKPVSIYVESDYVRAVKGGVGSAKTGANYATGLRAQKEASAQGYSQVLWLDGVQHKYIEEVGNMNVFFVLDGNVVTPALNGSILSGITRMSVIQLLESWNVPVEQRLISMEEVYEAHKNGKLQEAFGTGTAAVISSIGYLSWQGELITLSGGEIGELTGKIYDTITGIQKGQLEDTFGWTVKLD
jgi:branched-chain amino acid aminotransferase